MNHRLLSRWDVSLPVWCACFAAYEAYCLWLGRPLWHVVALAIQLVALTLTLIYLRRRAQTLRTLARFDAYARALLRVRAWELVYKDRIARRDRCAVVALSGWASASDIADSVRAAMVADRVLP